MSSTVMDVGARGGELRALVRLGRQAPGAVFAAGVAVLLSGVGVVVAFDAATAVGWWERLALVLLGLAGAICASLGALIVASVRRHGVGIALLIGGTLAAIWMVATGWGDGPHTRAGFAWAIWVENWAYIGLVILMTWPLLLFPDGRLPSRRWRPVAAFLLVANVALVVSGMLDPGTLDAVQGVKGVRNPLGVPDSWTWVNALGVFGFGVPVGVITSLLAARRRAAVNPQRPAARAGRWAARGLLVNIFVWLALAAAGSGLTNGPVYGATFTLAIAGFAVASAVTVLDRRTVEVDRLLRRAFIVIGVTAVSLAAFVVVFAIGAAVAGDTPGAIGGAFVVALIGVPVSGRVRARVDAALYGHRDPSTAVARLNEEIETADDPTESLPGLARAVGETVGASGVLLEPDPRLGLGSVGWGAPPEEPRYERVMRHRGRELGRIVLGARAPGEEYPPADLALIELLVRHISLAVEAVALAAQLQRSRGEIITAREQERRRLRRDLHDGLGPALAGIALTLEAAQNSDQAAGSELIDGAREQTHAVVAEVRRIVRGLRPPTLDALGLAAALRAHADRLAPLKIEIECTTPAPQLTAAAEVAVYRIVTEALTNVVRHADATRCDVSLRDHENQIVVRIADDGHGIEQHSDPGIGLRSMRERAAELGGHVELGAAELGGLAVTVRLPHQAAT
jgi:signal transduction histidine kinase